MTYKKAGVNIDRADTFLKKIKPLLEKTKRPEVLGKIGGFSGLFMPQLKGVKNPVLVSSTDGVGTKLMLADLMNKYDTVGVDLVAMCVDDVVVVGAEPLFFLDYIACGKLNKEKLYELMKGITKGCQEAGCALIGGETAELPGMYSGDKFDLAGFCVGVVSREKIIDGHLCRKGDKVIGLASSGIHSNGFSLVRKLFSTKELRGKLGKEFLKPTRIYARSILKVMKEVQIKAVAHITGGGFYENIPRVLPGGLSVEIKRGSWTVQPIFRMIQERSQVNEKEMFRTFNMGIGMALILGPRNAQYTLNLFEKIGQKAWIIGEVIEGDRNVSFQD
ncbi:MAG: phosphoribosylformylglycinamidine cyclo-ligase [Candidatus Aminicenantes bacterium]|nr:phosphoribosylformylglycinamidine cyclo-ligase [Candidatus Aminicenantes bacterium]MBL7083608.1 phosphoribosylformylglycinamidine cyclo-ligase [Candidatus Aminicenantes bacterium]